MTIRYQCTECESVLKIRDDKAGQAGHCPKCQAEFVIPEPDEAEPGSDEAEPGSDEAEPGSDDAEDDAMAFLMESGDVSGTAPLATTALDDDEMAPAIPPPPPSPEERQLHRPPQREHVDPDDTSNAAGKLLARSESARAAAVNEEPVDTGPRIDMDDVRQVAKRRLLPIGGGIVVLVGICYFAFNMMSGNSNVPPLALVSGTVTLDGKPLPQATVNFEPVKDTGTGGSVGRSGTNGVYTLTYVGDHNGAVPGTYIVRVNKTDEKGLEVLATKYHRQSQMKHEVKAGSNTINLDLKSEPGGNVPVVDPLTNPLANPLANPPANPPFP